MTRPENSQKQFQRLGTFKRIYFVLALFVRVVHLLEKYKPADFYSKAIYFYALLGLKLNVDYFDAFYQFAAAQAKKDKVAEEEELPPNYWGERISKLELSTAQNEPDLGINWEEDWESLLS
jgi:hypothetical protein